MKLEGDIGEIHLVDRLVELGREHFTGAIRFENDGIIKIIYFKGGDVLSASTNDRADSIDEILLRAGKINRDHLKQALAKRKETETLGDALLNLGFITRKELTWARRVQVIGTIRSVNAWTSGSFTIVSEYLPKREEGTLFSLQQIIIELIVTDQDRPKFERELDGGSAIFHQTADFATNFRGLGLNQDAEDIVNQVDGRKTAADVAAASGKDAFNVYKLLYALEVLGQLAKAWKPQVIDEVSPHVWVPPAAAVSSAPQEDTHWDAPEPQFGTEDASLDWGAPPPEVEAPHSPPARDLPPWDAVGKTREVPQMPAWDAPEPPLETPRPIAAASHEDNWGFDEAQIETAKRGSTAGPAPQIAPVEPVAVPKRRFGLIVAILVIAAVGAGGYAGFIWWLKKGEERDNVTARSKAAGPPLHPRSRLAAGTTGSTTTSAATPPATTTSIPTPASTTTSSPAPLVVTAASGKPAATGSTSAAATKPPRPASTTSAPDTAAVVIPKTAGGKAGSASPASATTASASTLTPRSSSTPPKPPLPQAKSVAATTTTTGSTRIETRPAGTTPLITNQPSGTTRAPASRPPARPPSTPSTDPQRARYDALARENAAMAGSGFTIQFEVACETSSVDRAVKEGGTSIWFVPVEYHGRACYRVFWGKYPTREEAVKAISQIPKDLRGGTPVVMSIPR